MLSSEMVENFLVISTTQVLDIFEHCCTEPRLAHDEFPFLIVLFARVDVLEALHSEYTEQPLVYKDWQVWKGKGGLRPRPCGFQKFVVLVPARPPTLGPAPFKKPQWVLLCSWKGGQGDLSNHGFRGFESNKAHSLHVNRNPREAPFQPPAHHAFVATIPHKGSRVTTRPHKKQNQDFAGYCNQSIADNFLSYLLSLLLLPPLETDPLPR